MVRRPRCRRRPTGCRGLTLLELLIAIAVIIGLGGLIMSAVLAELDERRFEQARDLMVESTLR